MTFQTNFERYDAVIVGARCAGAATAMLLAKRGLRVLAIDKSRYGSDTLSTHVLMRPAVLCLRRWGLLDALQASGAFPIRKTSFHYRDELGSQRVDIDIKPRHGVGALYAPRRTVLDPILVDAARAAGAEVRHGVGMTDLIRSADGRVQGLVVSDEEGRSKSIRADLVIGADGRHSRVAQMVGAQTYQRGRACAQCVFGYFDELHVEANHWYYQPGLAAGLAPTRQGQAVVFASLRGDSTGKSSTRELRQSFSEIVGAVAPELQGPLGRSKLEAKLRSFPGEPGHFRVPIGPGWALVGDAGYFTDPITAHGISNAFRDAELLTRAIVRNAFPSYQAERDALSSSFFEASDQIASFDWDIATVKQLHRVMSAEMNREADALLELDREDREVFNGTTGSILLSA